MSETRATTSLPESTYCPIGSLHLHALNYERTECIWCGPNALGSKDGRWVDLGNGFSAWSVEQEATR